MWGGASNLGLGWEAEDKKSKGQGLEREAGLRRTQDWKETTAVLEAGRELRATPEPRSGGCPMGQRLLLVPKGGMGNRPEHA